MEKEKKEPEKFVGISIKKMKTELRNALDKADPNLTQYPEIKRARINWTMKPFTDEMKKVVGEFRQFREIKWEFTEEQIKAELTTCHLKSEALRIRLAYSHKDNSVAFFCIGKNIDGVAKDIPLSQLCDEIRVFFPKRKIIIKRKKA